MRSKSGRRDHARVEYLDYGVVALVRRDDGKYLLLKDARQEYGGLWAPPHGVCESSDANEETCVLREVFEKSGLYVTPRRKLLTQPADSKLSSVAFWTVDMHSDEVQLDDKSSDYGWFSLEEALELELFAGTRKVFEQIAAGTLQVD